MTARPLPRETWRVRLAFYEDGRFAPGGFVHLDCRTAYFEIDDVVTGNGNAGHNGTRGT